MMNNNASLERQIRTLRKRSTFTLFLTWLALFFTVVGISAGYKNFLRVHDKAKAAQQSALQFSTMSPNFATKQSVEEWQQDIVSQLETVSAQSAAELAEIKAVRDSNQFITDTLNKQIERVNSQQNKQQASVAPSQQWKANEARYLLQVASRKLTLDKDVTAAKQALILADQALSEAAVPDLLSVRAQIAKDIVALNSYRPMYVDNVILQIARLSRALKPTAIPTSSETVVNTLLDVPEEGSGNSVINRVKESINKAVVIRSYDENLAKQINGDTDAVRYALIQLKLESLKLLALQQQQSAYDLQLEEISEQLSADNAQQLSSEVTSALKALKSFDLTSSTPQIQSVELLDAALAKPSGDAQ
ncbi:hypothetical protein EOL70_10005 [Leucothrix sargassi]|nr:hypothetical protein EOL70_10005 [Leucothrix sargassi]